jgi:hypothetical protein
MNMSAPALRGGDERTNASTVEYRASALRRIADARAHEINPVSRIELAGRTRSSIAWSVSRATQRG